MTLFKKNICIDANNWRYKVAQCVLSFLYGRKSHYISPWKHASVGACAFIMHNNKLLVTKRAAHLEFPNIFCLPGGHVDIEKNESILEALARELKEELLIDLDFSDLDSRKPIDVAYVPSQKYHEISDAGHISLTYIVKLNKIPNAQLSNEVTEIRWVTYEEAMQLKADNNYIGTPPPQHIFK